MDDYLRDIFENPTDKEILEHSLELLKSFIVIQQNDDDNIQIQREKTEEMKNIDLPFLMKIINEKIKDIEEKIVEFTNIDINDYKLWVKIFLNFIIQCILYHIYRL